MINFKINNFLYQFIQKKIVKFKYLTYMATNLLKNSNLREKSQIMINIGTGYHNLNMTSVQKLIRFIVTQILDNILEKQEKKS